MKLLLGLVGTAGSGKTTIAKHLCIQHGFIRTAFGDSLKQMLLDAGMCTHNELYVEKTSQSRWLLQKIGTDIFRKQVDQLFWVKKTSEYIKSLNGNSKVVIDDIRFPEEAQMILDFGGILIKVARGDNFIDKTAGSDHESECHVQEIDCHHIVLANGGEVDRLLWQMEGIVSTIMQGGDA